MVIGKRWERAQEYEKTHWNKTADKIATGVISQLDWYEWKAREFEKSILKYFDGFAVRSSKLLEIGSGPVGIISFLRWGEKYAIDPLEKFFNKNTILLRLRNKEVKYLGGRGEELPFKNSSFSLIIIDNVIDHTESPVEVLQEIYRILETNGLIYLSVNIHTKRGKMIRSLMELFEVDKGHPFTLTAGTIRKILSENRYELLSEDIEDYDSIRKKHFASKNLRDRIKAYLGISEFPYTCVCKKVS